MIALAGHGKDPRLVQAELPIVPNVGDRVTHANKKIRNGIEANFGTVTGKRFDKRKKITWITVTWDDGTIYKNHVEGSGTLKVIESTMPKVGDRIKDRDGFIGEIKSISDLCITAENPQSIKSYSLKDGKPHLEVIPQVTEILVSGFGEEIIISQDAKPIEIKSNPIKITENRELYDLLSPVCDWYCGKPLATFAVNALGHALSNAREGKISEAVALLTAEVLDEVKKPSTEVRKLKEFLKNFSSIKEVNLAIATEPNLSVAALRMDESKVSVLGEKGNKSISPRTKRSKTCVDGISGKDAVINIFTKKLAELRQQAIALESSGASPKGVWLEKSRPSKRNFDQVCWKADKPHEWLGDKKSRYIGKVDSDEHKSAIAQFATGKRLRDVEKEIQLIEKNLQNLKD